MSLDCLAKLDELQERYFFRLPYAYIIADYVWPGIIMSPQRVRHVQNMQFGPDDIVIASYPKSGTTWMSELISALVYEGDVQMLRKLRQEVRVPWLELDQQQWWIRSVLKWAPLLGWSANPEQPRSRRRVCFTHLPLDLLPKSIIRGQCKLVYVARNPKDNAVSFFHHHRMARFLGVQKDLGWNEFFALYVSGSLYCGSWFEHVLSFWRLAQLQPSRVQFVKFEDMKLDMPGEVRKLMDFLGLALSQEQFASVLSHCSFEAMKDNQMANRDISWMFDKKVCSFMRKGQVGDWKNYFTLAQSAFFDQLYADRMAREEHVVKGLCFQFEPQPVESGEEKVENEEKEEEKKGENEDEEKKVENDEEKRLEAVEAGKEVDNGLKSIKAGNEEKEKVENEEKKVENGLCFVFRFGPQPVENGEKEKVENGQEEVENGLEPIEAGNEEKVENGEEKEVETEQEEKRLEPVEVESEKKAVNGLEEEAEE